MHTLYATAFIWFHEYAFIAIDHHYTHILITAEYATYVLRLEYEISGFIMTYAATAATCHCRQHECHYRH